MNYYQLIVKGSVDLAQVLAGDRLHDFRLVKSESLTRVEASLIVGTEQSRGEFEARLISWFHEDDPLIHEGPAPKGTLLWWKHITPRQAGRN